MAIRALLRLTRVTGEAGYRAAALRAVGGFEKHIGRRPEYFPTILLALLEDGEVPEGSQAVGGSRAAASDEVLGKVQVRVEPVGPIVPGRPFEVMVHLDIAPGFHIQAHEGGDAAAIRTVARLRVLEEGVAISQEWSYPPGEGAGYAGGVTLTAQCVLSGRAPAGGVGGVDCRVVVDTQVCSGDACLAPEQVTCDFRVAVQE